MTHTVIGTCPICGGYLTVSKMHCKNCNTHLEGSFSLCEFCILTKEQKHFVKMFLKNRGNIKDLEKDLGISYPTVRSKLNDIIRALGMDSKDDEEQVNKAEILAKVSSGEISAEEAADLLKNG